MCLLPEVSSNTASRALKPEARRLKHGSLLTPIGSKNTCVRVHPDGDKLKPRGLCLGGFVVCASWTSIAWSPFYGRPHSQRRKRPVPEEEVLTCGGPLRRDLTSGGRPLRRMSAGFRERCRFGEVVPSSGPFGPQRLIAILVSNPRSISCHFLSSSGVRNVTASPLLPIRPVRPTR
jgi:hypothetical protein